MMVSLPLALPAGYLIFSHDASQISLKETMLRKFLRLLLVALLSSNIFAVSQTLAGEQSVPTLGETIVVIFQNEPDLKSNVLPVMTYVMNGMEYIPIFSSMNDFEKSTSGAKISNPVYEIKTSVFLDSLGEDRFPILLNPGLESMAFFRNKAHFRELLENQLARSKDAEMEPEQQIKAAVDRLLKRSNDDAFVIIQHKGTKKFVQFAGNASQGLLFNLPSQPLNPEELARAKDVLKKFDIVFEEQNTYDKPGGKVIATWGSFDKFLGRDSALAAQIAWKVLTEVYQLKPPVALEIEEN